MNTATIGIIIFVFIILFAIPIWSTLHRMYYLNSVTVGGLSKINIVLGSFKLILIFIAMIVLGYFGFKVIKEKQNQNNKKKNQNQNQNNKKQNQNNQLKIVN